MNQDYRQYQFARIEGHSITRARLEERFKDPITDIALFEQEIERVLKVDSLRCAPWRTSEIERAAVGEGVRLAALECYWHKREQLRACEAQLQAKVITLMFPTLPKELLN